MYRLIFLMVICPMFYIGAIYQLSICAIFQNEAPYLKEWIEFHKLQGVTHFYLYNNCSTDDFHSVLAKYIQKREVSLIDWPYQYALADIDAWGRIQTGAYMDCIQRFGKETRWLAVLDTDEFLFSPSGKKLASVLNDYKEYAAVVANWVMFGTSGIYDLPPNSLLIENLTHTEAKGNLHIKSIVQPKYTVGCHTVHHFSYSDNKYAVETDCTPCFGPFSSKVKIDKLRINHYWPRTERYLHEYKIPRRNQMSGNDPQWILKTAESYNAVEDYVILQFVPRLRARLFP